MEEEIISVKDFFLSFLGMLAGIGGAVLYYAKVGVTENFMYFFWFYICFFMFYSFLSKWLYYNKTYRFFGHIVVMVVLFVIFVYLFEILDN
jgi:hypothetical protein